ncbi:MAG: AmmeMemoRadiSam system protein B [Bacteroidales bacterium]|nr:AmmeMemoRadiSam system protein B [Bacteroidales bacterium]
MEMKVRKAAFAGRFYPDDTKSIHAYMEHFLENEQSKIKMLPANSAIIGGVVPHAGIMYSGYEAVHFYEIVRRSRQRFDTVVIVNPNHTGNGIGIYNTATYSLWETPLGTLENDTDFQDALNLPAYNLAHDFEHSGEVQLPFIQHFFDFQYKIVMITMNVQHVDSAKILAEKLIDASRRTGKKMLLIASSDFNHYDSFQTGYTKDRYVIDEILKNNPEGVYSAVKKHQVSACGFGPIMTLLYVSSLLSTNPSITLLRQGHSGEVHPSEKVVDYASFIATCDQ